MTNCSLMALLLNWDIKRDSFGVVSSWVMTGECSNSSGTTGWQSQSRQVCNQWGLSGTPNSLWSDFFPASLCNIVQLLPVAQIKTPNISSLMLPLNSHSFFFSIWNALFFRSFRTWFQFLFLPELVSNSPMRENPIFIYASTSATTPSSLSRIILTCIHHLPLGCALWTAGDLFDSSAYPTLRLA